MALETLRTDPILWEIGPYHDALPGPMKLRLTLDGEVIAAARAETGFLHRGLEKTFELHIWQSAVAYADHLDPEGAAFGELAVCMAVEEICGIEVPSRANTIRRILCELTRVSSHLGFVARMSRNVGSETMLHYSLRDREKILDLFELMTGARYSINFFRFGGVRADITEGFIERVFEVCELIRVRIKECNDLFTYNHSFLGRTVGVGLLSAEAIAARGITGPNSRASGCGFDVRRRHPYCGYEQNDFEVPFGGAEKAAGDVHERFVIRLREISQCVEILRQCVDKVPDGPFFVGKVDKDFAPPAGEAYVRVESARGLIGCHVVSDGTRVPSRVQFRPPSAALFAGIADVLRGCRVEDLPVILASLDLGVAEMDR